jgi:hypothetical protein
MESFLRRCVPFLIALLISPLVGADGANNADVEMASNGSSGKNIMNKWLNSCDLVFHCVTTKALRITSEETTKLYNEPFIFALKDGELKVPKKYTVLGDGTANYDLTSGGCHEDSGKLIDNWLGTGSQMFEAKMFENKWVSYRDGRMLGVDISTHPSIGKTFVWYAECENFD